MPTRREAGRRTKGRTKQRAVRTDSLSLSAADARHQASERQARLLNLAHDAIIVREFGGRILYWNKGAEAKYGWTEEEVLGKITHSLLQTVFPESREAQERRLLYDGFWEGELVHIRRDGSRIAVASRQVLDRESSGDYPAVLEINRNITTQKELEAKLRANERTLLDLTRHLLQSQDEERQRISRELHDATSQILTGVLSRLHLVRQGAQGLNEPSKQALSAALKLTEGLADFIRIFSSSLHPSILDEQGLAAAIRWYGEGITTQGNPPVTVEAAQELRRLPQTAERSLYRVAQETISLVRLRPATTAVNVRLGYAERSFVLEIIMEGAARADASQENVPMDILGLTAVGVRERVRQLGGQLELHSRGRSMVLRAVVPLRADAGSIS
jgi:PAS domain S-box-containing protein